MSTDDSEMQGALDDYNNRMAKSRRQNRIGSGLSLCAGAALTWGLSLWACYSVFKDPAVAVDFDAGTHTRDIAGRAWTGAVSAITGLILVVVALVRGPALIRWVGGLMLLCGVAVFWVVSFTFLLVR